MRTCHTCKAITKTPIASGWTTHSRIFPDGRIRPVWECLECIDKRIADKTDFNRITD